jgi:hypothetical protein
MGFCEYGELAGKKYDGNGVSDVLAVAFGIPFGLQGKPLTIVQLAYFFLLLYTISKP